MSKYVLIEKDRCIGCGGCVAVAPHIFKFDVEGYAEVHYMEDNNRGITPIEDAEHIIDLLDAVDGCPTIAVKMQDVPFSR
ncbi:ferredoxin [Paenibacillus septentrionalis]|uniref:Ferredoxin n=1 Tax=Paenibacillus septentrionalis TaxID=429342 RepID=A0ABW1V2N3_9BACL